MVQPRLPGVVQIPFEAPDLWLAEATGRAHTDGSLVEESIVGMASANAGLVGGELGTAAKSNSPPERGWTVI